MDERIEKYFLGKLNRFERMDLLKDLESDSEAKKEFIRFQNIVGLIHLSGYDKDEKEGADDYNQFVQGLKRKKQVRIFFHVIRYAAVISLLIVSTAILTMSLFKEKLPKVTMSSLYVPPGQRARLMLQDGTEVWLNANSTLLYPSYFSGNKRRVVVTGEAFFNVAKNAKKPFIVSTRKIEMKVLGTKFNVYSYPESDYVRTSLIEGAVEVKSERAKVTLKPNEQVTIRGGQMQVENITFSDYFLWKDGIYCFENERLISIIKKLELYYDVTIIVHDPQIFNVTYTGKFRQRDGIDEILQVLSRIRHFHVKKDVERNIITLSK
ncbi:MAG: FecR domain-containing protein [Parabacteroides sp.]|nr:FecR domain-containing protein [Parabacteroides sp.]